ncbi:MAG TPA: CsbD family protein [Clostridiales bacterium]|nr:CsbD family protein [Clostridiales bacterium]
MNESILKGKWKQIKGSAKIQWGKLTNDDLDVVEGNFEKLSGIIQEKYGRSKEEADAEISAFEKANNKS